MIILKKYLKQYPWILALAMVLALINQVFSMLDPIVFKHIIDDYALNIDTFTKNQFLIGVGKWLCLSILFAFISRVAKNFQDYFVNVLVQKIGATIYSDGLRHSLSLPFQVFEDQSSGETLGKLQKVRTDVERLLTSFINIIFPTIVGIVFVVVYSIQLHWLIAPVYLSIIPILGIISSILGKKIKIMQKKIVGATNQLLGTSTESLRNIELVKTLGLVDQEVDRMHHSTHKILGLELKKIKYIRSLSFIQGTSVQLLRTFILFFMLYLIFGKILKIGDFLSLWFFSFYIFGPIQELGNIINVYKESEVSLQNFNDIMNTKVEEKPDNPKSIDQIEQIHIKNLEFKHLTSQSMALSDITLNMQKGNTYAFVGPSGAGKTTLIKLITGLYRPSSGHIYYNQIPENEIDYDLLRHKIGMVSQDTQLFSGSIKDNLKFVNQKASDEQIIKVLEMSACQNLLSRVEQGIDSLIGEGGIKVSGGEKQRLSIARALLRNPEILIFDEATSALDSITEDEISQTIKNLPGKSNLITIMIAHRLSTIMHANQIIVLENGSISEIGTHHELLNMKGLYYAMWRQQVGKSNI